LAAQNPEAIEEMHRILLEDGSSFSDCPILTN